MIWDGTELHHVPRHKSTSPTMTDVHNQTQDSEIFSTTSDFDLEWGDFFRGLDQEVFIIQCSFPFILFFNATRSMRSLESQSTGPKWTINFFFWFLRIASWTCFRQITLSWTVTPSRAFLPSKSSSRLTVLDKEKAYSKAKGPSKPRRFRCPVQKNRWLSGYFPCLRTAQISGRSLKTVSW